MPKGRYTCLTENTNNANDNVIRLHLNATIPKQKLLLKLKMTR